MIAARVDAAIAIHQQHYTLGSKHQSSIRSVKSRRTALAATGAHADRVVSTGACRERLDAHM
jgi:hypothetical protein